MCFQEREQLASVEEAVQRNMAWLHGQDASALCSLSESIDLETVEVSCHHEPQ